MEISVALAALVLPALALAGEGPDLGEEAVGLGVNINEQALRESAEGRLETFATDLEVARKK